MKKVYLETTIPSYLSARPHRDIIVAGHQQLTHEWWDKRRGKFQLFISDFVVDEISKGDSEQIKKRQDIISNIEILRPTPEALNLAEALVKSKAVPQKAALDAAHIAVACIYKIDFFLTWNCKHIANAEMAVKIKAVCHKEGYTCPVICTPAELMGG